jgi:CRP/FNR family transcriptional regulator
VCEVSFDSLQQLAAEVSGMQAQMCRILASEVLKNQEGMLLRGRKTAEEKLAGFLLSVGACFVEQSAYEFDLSMSRNDIGSYLGITAETVSRVFTQFQQKRLIELSRRHVILNDRERLSRVAGHVHSKPFQRAQFDAPQP